MDLHRKNKNDSTLQQSRGNIIVHRPNPPVNVNNKKLYTTSSSDYLYKITFLVKCRIFSQFCPFRIANYYNMIKLINLRRPKYLYMQKD